MSLQIPAATPTVLLQDRLHRVRERIRIASEKSGRPAETITLVAVTKTVPADRVNDALALGLKDLGESKIQEAAAKRPQLSRPAVHHLIGSLQTNKARKAVELFDLIQSVDRPKLAEALDRVAKDLRKRQRCLIEVKISPEPAKSGIPVEAAPSFIDGFRRYENLALEGLMTIAPFGLGRDETRRCFRDFRTFFESQLSRLGERPILSMGMSDDFEVAVEEGATMVRIGRALFGERQ